MPQIVVRLRFALLSFRLFVLLLPGTKARNISGLTLIFLRLVGAAFRPRRAGGVLVPAAVHQIEQDAFAYAAIGDAQLADRPGRADRIEDRAAR
jgi:hypothetical protein